MKCVNMLIYGFSLILIFPYQSLYFIHIRQNLVHRKSLYLHILCSVQLSLCENLGTPLHLQNFVDEAPNLLHWHAQVQFFLHPQVTVYISGSVTICLLGINTESTEFQPDSTRFKQQSGADIRSAQIKAT